MKWRRMFRYESEIQRFVANQKDMNDKGLGTISSLQSTPAAWISNGPSQQFLNDSRFI